MNKSWLILLFSLWGGSLFAAIDVYQFDNTEKQARFQTLTAELRCPKCQNQNLADSNSEIATDLRTKIYQMLVADKSDDVIIDYMLARYGEFVLYKPRMRGQNLLLWYGPVGLLMIGLMVIFFIVRQRRQKSSVPLVDTALNKNQQHALATLLDAKHETKK
jgi:cytochrome c-type biogenesis protein CcmH